ANYDNLQLTGGCTSPLARSGIRVIARKTLCPWACATSTPNRSGPGVAIAFGRKATGLALQGLAFPEPVPIFAAFRPNNENEAHIAIEALEANQLKVTYALLDDETFGGGLFPDLYEEAGGWVLSS